MIEVSNEFIDNALGHTRSCDGCTACCHVVGVNELGKPYHTDCRHQCPGGCSIYEHRPLSCRAYLCGWRGGFCGGERPDKQGILLDKTPETDVFNVYEVWPGAFESEGNKRLLDEIAEKEGDVLTVRYGEIKKGEPVKMKWWREKTTIFMTFGKIEKIVPSRFWLAKHRKDWN
jgi:hypothetical protein